MYRSLSGPSGLRWFASVALTAAAVAASPAFAASASKQATSISNVAAHGANLKASALKFATMSRGDAAAAARVQRLFGIESQPAFRGAGVLAASCGDGLPGPGEQCDDDNNADGDGCSATCQIEAPFSCTDATGTSPMNDGGLELGGALDGTPNPFWAETGNQDLGGVFFTPICSESSCLGDPDAGLAIEGSHFAWFGGFTTTNPTPQIQTMTQTRTIPAARNTLSFFTLRGVCHSGNTDALVLTIDNNAVATVTCNTVDADWVLQSVNLATAPGGPYNNGASHTMKFTGTTTGAGDPNFSNIFVDFVTLGTGAYPAGVQVVASQCEDNCGDSSPNPGEQCDDGNTDDGDGCSALCTVEPGYECTDALPPQPIDALEDGSFEIPGLLDGPPNPFWAETSDIDLGGGQFFYPICNNNSGLCAGFGLPTVTGSGLAWYGGGVENGVQSVTQVVTIPPAATTLNYNIARQVCANGSPTDTLTVKIDGNTVATLLCNQRDFNTYHPYSVNLATAPGGPYNNGGSHTLNISASTRVTSGTNWTNFFLDGVSMPTGGMTPPTPSECTLLPEVCISEDFDGPGGGDLTGWTVFNTGALDIDWGTTDDGFCASSGNWAPGNYTGGTGEAACVDSDAAGPGIVDAYLCSPLYQYGDLTGTELSVLVNYQVFGAPTAEDQFELLSGTAAPSPGTIGGYESLFSTNQNIGILVGTGSTLSGGIDPQDGYLCFHYVADFDWYGQIDDLQISAESCGTTDSDSDGLADDSDNCTLVANNGQPGSGPAQNDTDGDGIGNMCDADFNQDCAVNFTDVGEMKAEFFHTGSLEEDMDGSGAVNFTDLGLLKGDFFQPPGPSGVPNVCSP